MVVTVKIELTMAVLSGLFALYHASARADSVVVFNEIMYHPDVNESTGEWVELYNQFTYDQDISGWQIRGGISYDFATGTIIPGGGHLVVAISPSELAAQSACTNAVGPFEGRLSNSGEELRLLNNSGRIMDVVDYRDSGNWPVAPDGSGVSLSKVRQDRPASWFGNWAWSGVTGGTPASNNVTDIEVDVAFNESASVSDTNFWVELFNLSDQSVELDNHTIVVSGISSGSCSLAGRVIPANGYLLLTELDLGLAPFDDDKLFLFRNTNVVVDAIKVGTSLRGKYPAGSGAWLYPGTASPGTSNMFSFSTEIVINEIMYHHQPFQEPYLESGEEWVELYNLGTGTVDLSSWEFDGAISFTFPPGTVMTQGQHLVVARDLAAFTIQHPGVNAIGDSSGKLSNQGETLLLLDANGNPADSVGYYDGGRWPEYADGGGSSLELQDPRADNSVAETWTASDESPYAGWQTYTYRSVAQASSVGPDSQWREFVLGLLNSGEVLIDDVSVTEDPDGAATQLISTGDFESGVGNWRIVGNHRHSEVVTDPDDASNQVLRLVASGPTEHMHNHAEITLSGGESVDNGKTYELSLRAKWLRGSRFLNTRLYFNRSPRTFVLDAPMTNGTPGIRNSGYKDNIGPTYTSFMHEPTVPDVSEPVTVSVVADDPDGVDTLTVWFSVNGGTWQQEGMTNAGIGRYAAQIPGQAASAIIHFYVEGTDQHSATSSFPSAGRDARALYKVNDGSASTTLQNFRIVMTTSDAEFMDTNIHLMSNEKMGCTIIFNESDVYYDAGVRLKGSERGRVSDARIGFVVGFNSDELYLGVHESVALDRSAGQSVGQREMLINQVMNRGGGLLSKYSDLVKVIAPKSEHTSSAELQLARFGDVYLDGQFDNGSDGTVFEYELIYYPTSADPEGYKLPSPDGVVGSVINDKGDDKENYRWPFLIKTQRTRDDYIGFIAFSKVFGLSGAAFNDQVGEVIDVDQWLRYMAYAVADGHGDSYPSGSNRHNTMFYERASDGRLLFFPHDMDFSYSATRSLVPNSDLGKLIGTPSRKRLYYSHMFDILNTAYNTAYMQAWTDRLGALLPSQNFASYLTFIDQRHDFLMGELFKNVSTNDMQFTVTNESSVVDADNIVIGGAGWIDVYEVFVSGRPEPLMLTWDSTGAGSGSQYFWEAEVALDPGENDLVILAYDYQGELVGSNSLVVVSTVEERPVQDDLRLTELMYAPAGGSAYEFVELRNTGTNMLDISQVQLTGGIEFSFADGSITHLAPDACVLIIRDRAGFASRYDTNTLLIAGEYTGKLNNGGEELGITGKWNVPILDLEYREGRGWPLAADGAGHSLVPVDAAVPGEPDGSLYYGRNWRASTYINGSPGSDDPILTYEPVVNELVAHTDYTNLAMPEYDSNDLIELYNPSTTQLALASWFLSDDEDDLRKWAIPGTNTVSAGGWIVFDEVSGFHSPITNGFGLDKAGEQVFLSYLPGTDEDRVADCVRFKGQEPDIALGRYVAGDEFLSALDATPGASNAPPIPGLVISEIMYNPASEISDPETARDEYVEIHNPLNTTAELWSVAGPWRIDGGVTYTFSIDVTLPPNGYLLVVSFDPDNDPVLRDAFLGTYGLTNGQVRLLGPYSGKLSNMGERVAVERPQNGDLPGDPVSYVIVDEAIYFCQSPWPETADTGKPLQRNCEEGSGNDPTCWGEAFVPTPGGPSSKITIVAPAANASVLMPVSETVRAVVDDGQIEGDLDYVEFLLNDTQSLGKVYAPPFQVQLISADFTAPGVYSLTAVLHDASGANVSAQRYIVAYESLYKDWDYRMPVSISGYTNSQGLENFPVLVKLHEGLGGFDYNQFSSVLGSDLRVADVTGTNILYHEVESWDPGGTSCVWILMSEFPVDSTSLWIYWGNDSATAPPAYATNGTVWANGFGLVQHMADDTGSTTVSDSTSNDVQSTFRSSYTWEETGQIGRALGLPAIGSAVQVADPYVPLAESWTISTWFKGLYPTSQGRTLARTFSGDRAAIVKKTSDDLGVQTGLDFTDSGYDLPAGNMQWHHIAAVGEGGVTLFYLNGKIVGSASNQVSGSIEYIANTFSLFGGECFAEYIDEFRIDSVARSSNWIWTCWMNQGSNDLFNTYGSSEENNPLVEVPLDVDGDGMMDLWEIEHFGSTNAPEGIATNDPDKDGLNNDDEFTAGTNPTNSNSVFWVDVNLSNGAALVEFFGVDASGYGGGYQRYYSLENATNLEGGWSGVPDYTNLPGEDRMIVYSNSPGGFGPLYFRGQVWLVE